MLIKIKKEKDKLQVESEMKNMGNENKKDFNVMMNNNKDMPKIQVIKDEKTIKKYGGTKMFFAPPIYYDKLMKKIPANILNLISGILLVCLTVFKFFQERGV